LTDRYADEAIWKESKLELGSDLHPRRHRALTKEVRVYILSDRAKNLVQHASLFTGGVEVGRPGCSCRGASRS
jgi:hypothetical protein